MSVSAVITTEKHEGVLTIPLTALNTDRQGSYVEVLEGVTIPEGRTVSGVSADTTTTQVRVETGLSNDTLVEIVSGLSEGDVVVSGTIVADSGSTSSASSQSSLFPTMGGGGTRTGGEGPRSGNFPR